MPLILSEKPALPRDLLKVPLLKATLDRRVRVLLRRAGGATSLMGTLRRLAYEHHLTFSGLLVQQVIDSPAELALWRGSPMAN